MNGGEKLIYDAVISIEKKLTEIETKQAERHRENKRFFDKVDNLPCEGRIVQTRNMINDINRLYKWLWVVVGAIVVSAVGHLMGRF